MALILEEKKFNEVKKDIKKYPKATRLEIAKKHFLAMSTVSRIANSKNYQDYREKHTTNKPLNSLRFTTKKVVEETPVKKSFFSKLKEFFK